MVRARTCSGPLGGARRCHWRQRRQRRRRFQRSGGIGMKPMASVQDTSVDVVWIRGCVVALGHRAADRCYRAAFAREVERVQPLLAGFAGFLNALSQASVLPPSGLQVLVRAERADLSAYAARLEGRALALPRPLGREALEDAAWARQEGPGLGLLRRRGYLIVPAESV